MAPFYWFFALTTLLACRGEESAKVVQEDVPSSVVVGAERMDVYLPKLNGKKVACVVNHTSVIGNSHLVDSLLALGVEVVKIMSPEHGFRGEAANGEKVDDSRDFNTGLPIVSLYGNHKKPTKEDLDGIDIVVFDIQDVGARFYTYIYTMAYVMEACAENGVEMLVMDRPNPNAHFVDGPMMKPEFTSFIGLHPIPVVHGMTIGEYAQMVNGENWLNGGIQCKMEVVEMQNYNRNEMYILPIKPSPNLPNIRSILLYPSLCFFEGTNVSVGRGTNKQFQVFGSPGLKGDYSFTPVPMPGAGSPFLQGKECTGTDLTSLSPEEIYGWKRINLQFLIASYQDLQAKGKPYFLENGFFEKLAGTEELRKQIEAGWTEDQIRKSWTPGLDSFQKTRTKYLIYK